MPAPNNQAEMWAIEDEIRYLENQQRQLANLKSKITQEMKELNKDIGTIKSSGADAAVLGTSVDTMSYVADTSVLVLMEHFIGKGKYSTINAIHNRIKSISSKIKDSGIKTDICDFQDGLNNILSSIDKRLADLKTEEERINSKISSLRSQINRLRVKLDNLMI